MNFLAMFEFTMDDLKSNQRGLISVKQKDAIENIAEGIRKSQRGSAKAGVFFLFFGLCIILGMFLSSENYRAMLFTDPSILLSLGTIVLIVFGILALSIYLTYRRADRFSNSGLKEVEGLAHLDETHSSKTGSTYY